MFTLTQYLLGLVVALISYIILKTQKAYRYWSDRGIAQTKPWVPFMGDFLPLISGKLSQAEFYINAYKMFPNEKVMGFYMFMKPSLLVRDPNLIQRILVNDFSHFVDRVGGQEAKIEPIEESLLVMSGQRWKAMRKTISPVFTSGKIKGMFSDALACGDNLVRYVDSTGESEFLGKDLMAIFTANVIATNVFGLNLGDELNLDSEFVKQATQVFVLPLKDRLRLLIVQAFPGLIGLLGGSTTNPDSTTYFEGLLRQAVAERSKAGVERNDFMNMLLRLREKGTMKVQVDPEDAYLGLDLQDSTVVEELTDDILMAQAFLFLAAGFDTTSTTLEFLLFELSRNPKAQDKLREELMKVVQEEGGNLTYNSLAKLTYMEKCIKETLRMYPATPALFRLCTKEYDLEGLRIHPGQTIEIPHLAIQTDPEYYPEPEKFIPERFEVEPMKGTYMPFGEGPRMCIGMRVAQMNLKVGLISLLRNYRIEQSSKNVLPIKFQPRAILCMPKDSLWCKLVKI